MERVDHVSDHKDSQNGYDDDPSEDFHPSEDFLVHCLELGVMTGSEANPRPGSFHRQTAVSRRCHIRAVVASALQHEIEPPTQNK